MRWYNACSTLVIRNQHEMYNACSTLVIRNQHEMVQCMQYIGDEEST